MKKRIMGCLFFLLALVCAAAAAASAFLFRDKGPVFVYVPQEAVQQAEKLMDALCRGDFSEAETLLYGTPELGANQKPTDLVGSMIWDAYIRSLDYQLVGEPYGTHQGIAQDVKIISLEIPTATAQLGSRARELLNQKITEAEDPSELYDENNAYREDLVMEVLQKATADALEEDVRYSYQIVTLRLVYSDDQWWVAADQSFLNAVFCRTLHQEG